jgi:hypothetical protein
MVRNLRSGLVAAAAALVGPVLSMTSYPNEFFTPEDVLDSSWVANAKWAQSNTVVDAEFVAAQGPWSKLGSFFGLGEFVIDILPLQR